MSPAVEQIRKTVEERIRELRPVIDELSSSKGSSPCSKARK
jgi:hypothetical protein